MPDIWDIFNNQSEKYDLLVSREDYEHNLIKEINIVIDLSGREVLEFGAGTGRLTFQLCQYAKKVLALEKTMAMMNTAVKNMKKLKIKNCEFRQADNLEKLQLNKKFDCAIEGWSFLAGISSSPGGWKRENAINIINTEIDNMRRNVKNSGKLFIIESLGTYVNKPSPWDVWIPVYDHLEKNLRFSKKIIRTDFKFANLEDAVKLFPFFFGEEYKEKIIKENATIIPEYTGIWFKDNKNL